MHLQCRTSFQTFIATHELVASPRVNLFLKVFGKVHTSITIVNQESGTKFVFQHAHIYKWSNVEAWWFKQHSVSLKFFLACPINVAENRESASCSRNPENFLPDPGLRTPALDDNTNALQ